MKGQGATEYLVLLAVVLIIALVAISLLGFFPSMAADAKITQSSTYWRGEASPVAILDSSFHTDGVGKLVVTNNDAMGTIVIQSITLNSTNDNYGGSIDGGGTVTIAPGQQGEISIDGTSSSADNGSVYQFNVVIVYRSPSGLLQTEYGATPLTGKYN
jgi:hypothetical protein